MWFVRAVACGVLTLAAGGVLTSCAPDVQRGAKSSETGSVESALGALRTEVASALGPPVASWGTATFTPTGTMASARAQHGAVLLPSGEVLVVTGVSRTGFVASAERYDPARGTWSSAGSPGISGNVTSALLLPNGKVLVLTDGSETGRLLDPETGAWTSTGPMSSRRSLSTLTLLDNGSVLVAGGAVTGGVRTTSSELYDPDTNTFRVTAGAMTLGRGAHSTVRLRDGRVLAISGFNSQGEVPGADLFVPTTDTWTAAAPPLVARHYFTATLLPDGRVLVAGGFGAGGVIHDSELYDPVANTWTRTGSLGTPRNGHRATLLTSGRVLVTGGSGSDRRALAGTELYDPATGTWTSMAPLGSGRENHEATLLPTGQVLVTGGYTSSPSLTFFDSAEVFDPRFSRVSATAPALDSGCLQALLDASGGVTCARTDGSVWHFNRPSGTWSAAGALSEPRGGGTAMLLPSGRILFVGGATPTAGANAELYDPRTQTSSLILMPALAPREGHTATLLDDGSVLLVGGRGGGSPTAFAARYLESAAEPWQSVSPLALARMHHAAVRLPDGSVLIAGGRGSGDELLTSAERYDPVTAAWSTVAQLPVARERLALTLLPSGEVLATGGRTASGVSLAELYSPATDAWTPIAPSAHARWGHVASVLPSGTLMISGGEGEGGALPVERFDPALRRWTTEDSLAAGGRAVVLPSNEVLVVPSGAGTPMIWDDTAAEDARRPVVTGPERLYRACTQDLSGQRLRGDGGGSGGGFSDSPTDLPLVKLWAPEAGRPWALASSELSSTMARIHVPAEVSLGQHALTVFSRGLAGGRMVEVVENGAPVAEARSLEVQRDADTLLPLTASDPEGLALTWEVGTAPQHGVITVTPAGLLYTPEPGYEGPDTLTAMVRDACGAASAEVVITLEVRDLRAPEITCPEAIELEAQGPDGAAGHWPEATAIDATTLAPVISYVPAQVTVLPMGTTQVTATAEDSDGNRTSCVFDVRVNDTAAPALTCPAEVTVTATSEEGAVVDYAAPVASDTVTDRPSLISTPASGSVLPVGVHTVTATATDDAGNTSTCTFEVHVEVGAPAGGCGCRGTGGAAGLGLPLLLLLGVSRRGRRRAVGLES